jgi:hypothetical protein
MPKSFTAENAKLAEEKGRLKFKDQNPKQQIKEGKLSLIFGF